MTAMPDLAEQVAKSRPIRGRSGTGTKIVVMTADGSYVERAKE